MLNFNFPKLNFKWFLVACILCFSGVFLCQFFAEVVYYFWFYEVENLPQNEQKAIYGGVILFFVGIGLLLFSAFFFEKGITKNHKSIKIEGMDWEHFKPKIEEIKHEEKEVTQEKIEVKEEKKAEEKEKPPEQKPKYQAVQRGTKAIQTTQLRPQLSENQQQDIRNLINQSL